MDWWKIKDIETGRIDFNPNGQIANIPPSKSQNEGLYNGDEPVLIMNEALKKINDIYQKAWGRFVKKEELVAIFNFTMLRRENILSGIWKEVKVTEEDIKENRETLLKKIEKRGNYGYR